MSKKIIILIFALFNTILFYYYYNKPDYYIITQKLVTNSDTKNSGFSKSIAGLSAIAGITNPTNLSNRNVIAIELLKSSKFWKDYLENNGLLEPYKSMIGLDLNLKEDDWIEYYIEKYNDKNFMVEIDEKTSVIKLVLKSTDRNLSYKVMEGLKGFLNKKMMEKELINLSAMNEYIETRLNVEKDVEIRNVLVSSYVENLKNITLSGVNEDFIFVDISGVVNHPEPVGPKRFISIISLNILLLLFFIIFYYVRKNNLLLQPYQNLRMKNTA